MPFEIMDQRGVSVSSHFFEEIPFPSERQVGFQKLKTMPDYQAGVSGMVPTPGSTLGSSMPSKMYLPNGAPLVDYLDPPQSNLAGEQTERLSVVEGIPNISKASWKPMDHQPKLWSDLSAKPTPYSSVGGKTLIPGAQHESSLFSSSLSETFSKKLRLLKNDFISHQSTDNVAFQHEEEPFESLEEIEAQTIGNLLPDDNDLFSGMTDEPGYKAYANIGDGFEDFDLFSSGGGLEMEGDDQGVYNSSIAGEHPYGEHPSRTLFVRNINSNIEDLELKALFEQYGDIRALYTACKHRGFVMISYYDIRAAQNALRALQSKALRHRKLDIHYSIPKDNPSDKDINQGTLVLFNLDSSVSSDELSKIFGSYGEIKEIRETPHKPHNKFIEFYDVRAAEAALHALNRSEIGGKQIKLEPSRPGGIRRGLAQVSEQDRDEFKFCNGLSDNLSTGTKATLHPGMVTSSCMVNGSSLGLHSAVRSPVSAFIENALSHQSSSVPDAFPAPATLASIGKKFSLRDTEQSLDDMNFGNQSAPGIHPHSLPEYNDSLAHGIPCNTSGAIGIINGNLGLRMREGTDRRSTVSANGHLVELNGGAFGSPGNGSCPVHAHPYLWNNSNSYQQHPSSPMMWQNSPSFISGHSAHRFPQMPGFHRTPPHMLSGTSPVHLHVGSAPAVNPSIWEKHAFSGESTDTSNLHLGSLGFPRFAGSPQMHPMEISSQNLFSLTGGNFLDMTTSTRQRSSQEMGHMFPGRNSMSSMPTSFDSQNERGVRNLSHRRNEANPNNADKRQYELDVERILRGEDRRTTLMIKNIPNKYTSKMLLAAIDEQCRGIYDFLYLPIDFKNKCNVGYAFINMIDPHQIVPFYKAFNGKKWEKFNSEKVASLAYARIQGKAALIAHFQNSSLMNEDKRCRPILFHTEGPNAGDPEPFPMGTNIRSRPGKPRTAGYDDNHNHGSPSATANGEENSKESDRDLFYQDF